MISPDSSPPSLQPPVELNTGLTLVRFTANWCGPCKMFGPQFDLAVKELQIRYPSLQPLTVDVDQFPQVAAGLGVRAIPTVVLLKDGAPIVSLHGNMAAVNVVQKIGKEILQFKSAPPDAEL
jgi:thioredoxin 1